MKNKTLSIVIPYYHGKKYIENTLNSLVKAIKKIDIIYEIVIVNDSPEENIEFLKNEYDNVIIYNNDENKGIAESRNNGKKLCKNEYLYFIDQDDWVSEDFFVILKKYFDNDYDCMMFNFNNAYLNGDSIIKISKNYNFLFGIFLKYFLTDKVLLKYNNFFRTIGQLIIKKDIAEDFLVTKTKGSDDQFMFIDILRKKRRLKIGYISQPILNYRVHANNYTKSADFEKSTLECFEKYIIKNKSYKVNGKYLSKEYSNKLINVVIKNFLHRVLNV